MILDCIESTSGTISNKIINLSSEIICFIILSTAQSDFVNSQTG